ncbi:unnamed protein product [Rotaria sordida]|uniref:FYVE-type domain-containing protein n=2 Tax=Rotaria sordida TaxID=392033 RepID=A0A815BD47_9BILA|nr:unnamed protein product [Rotaria sordida]CAF0987092.1 unnamed protein product [Rotaria sordida]CAF1268085.1 unnamed protein product [Rotaria sordida]CAF3750252.1 unnamed protein product [Rotaria sordida]CAF3838546.1 unnamed protein product [Rotaria sordida]
MSKPLTRTYSLRKHIRPIIEIDEQDDDQRRDSYGRKRVDVVQCLLDSSSDEIDDYNMNIEKPRNILWLTFNEICHIRYVLVQTSLCMDKQYLQIRNGRICFRCRKDINEFFFLPSFLRFNNHERCFICQQIICKKCSYLNFVPPSLKLLIPIRIRTLIKSSSTTIENNNKKMNKLTPQSKTLCYDCLQLFKEHRQTSQHRIKPSIPPLHRTYSLPPISHKNSVETQYTRHRRRPHQITNCKFEKTTIITTSFRTDI